MSQTIVIAEISKGVIHPTTAELVTAANALGSTPIVIVPCTDSTIADAAASIQGISKVVALKSDIFATYDASSWATAIDAVAPSGTIIASANPQSKDLAARLAARARCCRY
jgi:electron transfer flavoprotein alpha subunit